MEPPEDSAPGDRIAVQGFEEHPDEQLNPKKKVFEQVSGGANAKQCCMCAWAVITYVQLLVTSSVVC